MASSNIVVSIDLNVSLQIWLLGSSFGSDWSLRGGKKNLVRIIRYWVLPSVMFSVLLCNIHFWSPFPKKVGVREDWRLHSEIIHTAQIVHVLVFGQYFVIPVFLLSGVLTAFNLHQKLYWHRGPTYKAYHGSQNYRLRTCWVPFISAIWCQRGKTL